MNILILGDVMGPSGREAIIKKLPNLIKQKKIDFVIVNGENAADTGVGITKKNTEDFFKVGVDVITSGNHIWDEKETMEFITSEERLLRPQNLPEGSPGKGYDIFKSKKELIPDLIMVPLVAFDKNLNRIGYGKGYYDRCLKKINKIKKNTIFLGIAYSFQRCNKIPINKNDFKLDYIFTERGIISSG